MVFFKVLLLNCILQFELKCVVKKNILENYCVLQTDNPIVRAEIALRKMWDTKEAFNKEWDTVVDARYVCNRAKDVLMRRPGLVVKIDQQLHFMHDFMLEYTGFVYAY